MAVRRSVIALLVGIAATGSVFADEVEKIEPIVKKPVKKSAKGEKPPAISDESPEYGSSPTAVKGAVIAPSKPMPLLPSSAPAQIATPSTSSTSLSNTLSRERRQRRQKWERALQEPAKLTVDDQKSITLGALLNQIRSKHGLTVQIDMQHVLPLTAAFEMGGQSAAKGQAAKYAMQIPIIARPGSSPLPSNRLRVHSAKPTTYQLPVELLATDDNNPPAQAELVIKGFEENSTPKLYEDAAGETEPSKADPKSGPVKKKGKSKNNENKKGDAGKGKGAVEEPESGAQCTAAAMKSFLETPIDAALVTRSDITVEDVLQSAMNQAFPIQSMLNLSIAEELPLPMSFTQAMDWDLLIQDHGVLVTTRLNANLQKETRVYSVRALEQTAKLKSEDVARIVTRTVRPWSWKKHFPEANVEMHAESPSKRKTSPARKLTLPKVDLSLLSLLLSSNSIEEPQIRLASDEETKSGDKSETTELTEEDLAMLAQAWESLFQGSISVIQVIYHADPPSGIVEVLPGLLIISQSQGAHREIADLLEQLQHPEN
ncbi:MAG: hypothetical protein WCJ09_05775 [Planctomycetota bacterium]